MYVIYFYISGRVQPVSWTSSLDTAKEKLEEYTLQHLRILDSESTHTIDNGIETRDEIDQIPDVEVEDAESVPKYSAKHIVGEAKRHHGNIRQINVYQHEVISGWTTYTKKSELIGYFAFGQINQAANLYPNSNAEMEEVRRDLEQEKIVIMASDMR